MVFTSDKENISTCCKNLICLHVHIWMKKNLSTETPAIKQPLFSIIIRKRHWPKAAFVIVVYGNKLHLRDQNGKFRFAFRIKRTSGVPGLYESSEELSYFSVQKWPYHLRRMQQKSERMSNMQTSKRKHQSSNDWKINFHSWDFDSLYIWYSWMCSSS